MPNDEETKEKPGDEVILGKKFPGERFSTVRSAKETAEQIALQKEFGDHPEAMPLTVYFSHRRIHDSTMQAMMTAYTKVRKATLATFDAIFKDF